MQTRTHSERCACTLEWWSLMTHKWSHVHFQLSSRICYRSLGSFSPRLQWDFRSDKVSLSLDILQTYLGACEGSAFTRTLESDVKGKVGNNILYSIPGQLLWYMADNRHAVICNYGWISSERYSIRNALHSGADLAEIVDIEYCFVNKFLNPWDEMC